MQKNYLFQQSLQISFKLFSYNYQHLFYIGHYIHVCLPQRNLQRVVLTFSLKLVIVVEFFLSTYFLVVVML